MCETTIKVGDMVNETPEYRKVIHNGTKRISGIVTKLHRNNESNTIATIRLFCGCIDHISTGWLTTTDKHESGCGCNHQFHAHHNHYHHHCCG